MKSVTGIQVDLERSVEPGTTGHCSPPVVGITLHSESSSHDVQTAGGCQTLDRREVLTLQVREELTS